MLKGMVLRRPPRGGRLREVAPVGGVAVSGIQAIPPCSAEAFLGRTPWMPSRGRFPEKARRIARSSSGSTARGRGFSRVLSYPNPPGQIDAERYTDATL